MPSTKKIALSKIRSDFQLRGTPVTAHALSQLRRDPRPGAQRLYKVLCNRFQRERSERLRLDAMLNFERLLWKSGVRFVAGVDEAGVGPLAGPVVAAAVTFEKDTVIDGVDDSKKLEPGVRQALAVEIRKKSTGIGIGVATVEEIDQLNIYHAALLAMRRAVIALPLLPEHLLVDARTIPDVAVPQNSFNKGDGINFSIAAASILAKTERDRLMCALDVEFPGYGFATHKGYATPAHCLSIKQLGPSRIHRMSFPVMQDLCGGCSRHFYEFKAQLFQTTTQSLLAALELKLEKDRACFDEQEYRKLRVLMLRRWKFIIPVQ